VFSTLLSRQCAQEPNNNTMVLVYRGTKKASWTLWYWYHQRRYCSATAVSRYHPTL